MKVDEDTPEEITTTIFEDMADWARSFFIAAVIVVVVLFGVWYFVHTQPTNCQPVKVSVIRSIFK